MKYFVYVLRSLRNNRFYTGSTNNLERRIKEHNEGRSKYTKLTKPFGLIYKEKYDNRVMAYKREMFLKSGKGRELLKKLLDKRA